MCELSETAVWFIFSHEKVVKVPQTNSCVEMSRRGGRGGGKGERKRAKRERKEVDGHKMHAVREVTRRLAEMISERLQQSLRWS
jgi:hypothetical protein